MKMNCKIYNIVLWDLIFFKSKKLMFYGNVELFCIDCIICIGLRLGKEFFLVVLMYQVEVLFFYID